MRGLLVLLLLLGGLACTQGKAEGERVAGENGRKLESEQVANTEAGVSTLDTNVHINRELTPFNGKRRFAGQWTDAAGTHRLIISGKYNYDEGEGKAEIFAYHYHKSRGEWTRLWKINDFVDGYGCDLQIHLFRDRIKVEDVNGDDIAETAFIYTLDNRCDASVVDTKLMLHTGETKLAIRGVSDQYLGPSEEILNQVLKEQGSDPIAFKACDPAFEKADPRFKKFASRMWDELIESQDSKNR